MKLHEVKGRSVADLNIKYEGGDLHVGGKKLTSLQGAPSSVSGGFDCTFNKLTTLEGAPSSVGGGFSCANNKLTSLQGAPSSVGGGFDCDHNQLTSLQGAPSSVGGGFYCSYNKLTSLEGSPSSVSGGFDCDHNQLTSLRSIHRIIKEINGYFYCKGNPIKSDLLYILLIKGVKGVQTPFEKIDKVIDEYLKGNPSGSMRAVFDVKELLAEKGLTAP